MAFVLSRYQANWIIQPMTDSYSIGLTVQLSTPENDQAHWTLYLLFKTVCWSLICEAMMLHLCGTITPSKQLSGLLPLESLSAKNHSTQVYSPNKIMLSKLCSLCCTNSEKQRLMQHCFTQGMSHWETSTWAFVASEMFVIRSERIDVCCSWRHKRPVHCTIQHHCEINGRKLDLFISSAREWLNTRRNRQETGRVCWQNKCLSQSNNTILFCEHSAPFCSKITYGHCYFSRLHVFQFSWQKLRCIWHIFVSFDHYSIFQSDLPTKPLDPPFMFLFPASNRRRESHPWDCTCPANFLQGQWHTEC